MDHNLSHMTRDTSGEYWAACTCGEVHHSMEKDTVYERMADHVLSTPVFRSLVISEALRRAGGLN